MKNIYIITRVTHDLGLTLYFRNLFCGKEKQFITPTEWVIDVEH